MGSDDDVLGDDDGVRGGRDQPAVAADDALLVQDAVVDLRALLDVRILPSVILIGCTTFLLSAAGVKAGSLFGAKYEKKAEILGGVILILLGIKTLLEHLGVL